MGECADARKMSAHALAGPAFAAAFPAARIVPANIKYKKAEEIDFSAFLLHRQNRAEAAAPSSALFKFKLFDWTFCSSV